MAQRASGFSRVPMDLYQTPAWVIDALADHIFLRGIRVWEPAAGEGKMCAALQSHDAFVFGTDSKDYGISRMVYHGEFDFTVAGPCPWVNSIDLICTNPPYGVQGKTAERFIELGLERMGPRGALALLLPVDFDSGKTRAKFFADSPVFLGKIVLTKRIRWFEPEPGKKSTGPSANHAWFIWGPTSFGETARPRLFYAPTVRAA